MKDMKEDNDDIDRIIECNKCGKVFKYNYLLIIIYYVKLFTIFS